jgi:hypothetical protein
MHCLYPEIVAWNLDQAKDSKLIHQFTYYWRMGSNYFQEAAIAQDSKHDAFFQGRSNFK